MRKKLGMILLVMIFLVGCQKSLDIMNVTVSVHETAEVMIFEEDEMTNIFEELLSSKKKVRNTEFKLPYPEYYFIVQMKDGSMEEYEFWLSEAGNDSLISRVGETNEFYYIKAKYTDELIELFGISY